MLLQIAGGILITYATTRYGFEKANEYETRVNTLLELERCLQYLKTEIRYGYTVLPEAIKKTADIASPQLKEFFNNILKYLTGENPIQDAFTQAIGDTPLPLTNQDKEILKHLGNDLGEVDTDNQIKAIELIVKQLQGQQQEALTVKNKKSRLCKELGFLIGLGISLLVL